MTMTNSVKTAVSSSGSKPPSTGHGGATNVSLDQFSIAGAPSSAGTTLNFKRPGSGKKRSAKSFRKVEKNFSMTPRFSIMASSPTPSANQTHPKGSPKAKGFDPTARSESIGVHHRLPIGEHLVTQIQRRPTTWPTEFKDEPKEYDPDEEARQWRRRIEAALRMYPRNTWGPITKWGYLEEVPENGDFKQKEHYKVSNSVSNHDKMEKKRIGKRDIGFVRSWTKHKDPTHPWEDTEEGRKSLANGESQDQYARDAEKMLQRQNDERLAKIKRNDERCRSIKNTKEFTRLERREEEYLKIENETQLREDPGARKIKSSVHYSILAPDFRPGEDGFAVKLKEWRACMRFLRIQSKQSGALMYDVISWTPQRPCRVPPPKPDPSDVPEETPKLPADRKPSPAHPRNILHSLDREDEVPVQSTQDNRTDW